MPQNMLEQSRHIHNVPQYMSECLSVIKCPSCNITFNSVHKYVIKDVTIYIAIYACQNLCVTVGITGNAILLSWLLDVEYQESMQGNVADISMDTADGVEAEPSHFPLRAAEGAAVPIFTHDSPWDPRCFLSVA
jgi:hypothetical protein